MRRVLADWQGATNEHIRSDLRLRSNAASLPKNEQIWAFIFGRVPKVLVRQPLAPGNPILADHRWGEWILDLVMTRKQAIVCVK